MSTQQTQPPAEAKQQERLDLQRQMAVQRGVDLAMNQLIENMVELVDQTGVAKSRMEKHQIKNLLSVALETRSVEVVKHFILYQVGRDVSGLSWRHNRFGEELVKRIDELRQVEVRQIMDQVDKSFSLAGNVGQTSSKTEEDETWILLVRAYLGQLNRYFYYKKEV